MIIRLSKVVLKLLVISLFLYSTNGIGDQSDSRLDDLFDTLKNSQNSEELTEAETTIWTIWYESGHDEVDVLMAQGERAIQAGELAIAESLYTQVVEQAPKFSEGWNRRATIRFYRKNYDGSLEDIKHTLYLEPRHFGAFWGLGMILGSKRDFSAAIAAFERLLEIKPNAADARWRIERLREEMARSAV